MKYYLLILLVFPLIVGGLELRVIIKNRRNAKTPGIFSILKKQLLHLGFVKSKLSVRTKHFSRN